MTDATNIPPANDDDDDTEGHMPRVRFVESAGEDDTVDTEGHKVVPVDERVSDRETATAEPADDGDDPDDTEGHRASLHHVGVDFD